MVESDTTAHSHDVTILSFNTFKDLSSTSQLLCLEANPVGFCASLATVEPLYYRHSWDHIKYQELSLFHGWFLYTFYVAGQQAVLIRSSGGVLI